MKESVLTALNSIFVLYFLPSLIDTAGFAAKILGTELSYTP